MFAINVVPTRGSAASARACSRRSAGLRLTGVTKLPHPPHDNTLILSFFRGQGMMAGPLIPLEMDPGRAAGGRRMKLQMNTLLALYSVIEFALVPSATFRAPQIADRTASRRTTWPRSWPSSRGPALSSRSAASAVATDSPATRAG